MNSAGESDNLRLIRRVYAAWDAEDMDAAFADLDPEFRCGPGLMRHGPSRSI